MTDRDPDAVIEDLEFLVAVGVGATDAARRTGFPSRKALEKWLDPTRHNRPALWAALLCNEPLPLNHDTMARRWAMKSRVSA